MLGLAQKISRRWACLLMLGVFLLDVVLADPLPFVDEALLGVLTAACFRKHARDDASRKELEA